MERWHALILLGMVLIASIGLTARLYINQNVELVAGMTSAEYNQRLSELQERRTSFEQINSSPSRFQGEEVVVKGQVDLALGQEDRYIVYPLLEREKKLYFTDCKRDEPIGDSAYIRGNLKQLESKSVLASDSNLTAEQRKNMEAAKDALKEYNYSVPEYMDNDTEYIWGIECRELLPVY